MAPIPLDDLSDTQRAAVEAVSAWYQSLSSFHSGFGAATRLTEMSQMSPLFRMFGYAGSGKTSIAQTIVDHLGLRDIDVVYAAFTGKACHVLRTKGCLGARTIHSLIYKPFDKVNTKLEITRLEEALKFAADAATRRDFQKELRRLKEDLDQPGWVLNRDSSLRHAKLCIIDEVSMVNQSMARDLMSFGVPILVLGDPAQLPPVKGSGWFMDAEPDVMLTEIHRSEAGSSVTRVATTVRTGAGAHFGLDGMVYGEEGPPSGRWGRRLAPEEMARFDVVLCWRNDTRWDLTRKLRRVRGFDGDVPNPGERIIILANDADLAVYNGQEFRVDKVTEKYGLLYVDVLELVQLPDGTEEWSARRAPLPVMPGGFLGMKQQTETEKSARFSSGVAVATFAHVITVHKAQGSQWEKVLTIDESSGVRRRGGEIQARQWLYTAASRAAKQVIVGSA